MKIDDIIYEMQLRVQKINEELEKDYNISSFMLNTLKARRSELERMISWVEIKKETGL